MSRHIRSLSHEQLTVFDLEAFVTHANTFNQHCGDLHHAFPQGP